MDFNEAHIDAISRGMNKYHFRILPTVEPEAIKWLKAHAMDCIVWSQRMIAFESDRAPATAV